MTVVWICVPSYHKTLPTLALNFSENCGSFEKPYQTLESVFHQIQLYPNTSKSFLKNSAAPRLFKLLLSVWIPDETHLLVFDIHVSRKHKLIELEVHSVLVVRTSNLGAEAERSYVLLRFEAKTFLRCS